MILLVTLLAVSLLMVSLQVIRMKCIEASMQLPVMHGMFRMPP
jgi:hypothetical protein